MVGTLIIFFLIHKKNLSFVLFCLPKKEEGNIILLVFKYLDYTIQPELSSPPRFRIQGGGPLSVTEEHGGERKSLCLIFLILDVTLRRSDTVILRHSDTETTRHFPIVMTGLSCSLPWQVDSDPPDCAAALSCPLIYSSFLTDNISSGP